MINSIVILLMLALLCPHSFASPFPMGGASDMNENENDSTQISDDVRDLESLRTGIANKANNSETAHEEGSPLRDSSEPIRDSSEPLRDSSEPLPTPLPQSESPQANSRSAIFRHRGITEAKKSYWPEKMPQPSDAYKFVGIQYSPADLAVYAFNTGDEEGVAVAVEELVREGMMGRTDAIKYLQDVKELLSFLRNQCKDYTNRAYPKPELTQRVPNPPREQFISAMDLNKRDPKTSSPVVTTEHPHETVIASTSEPKVQAHSASTTTRPKSALPATKTHDDEDLQQNELDDLPYKTRDLKRRLPAKNPAFKLESFALQVLYKIAKETFIKSMMREDLTELDALTGLLSYVEMEVGNNVLPPEMKEKVLEAISAALVDSLREYQNFVQLNEVSNFDQSDVFQHQSKAGKIAPKVPMSDIFRKLALEGHENMLELASKNNRPKSS